MNCAAAETWLLTARSASELPDPVREHLAQCRGCARRLESLVRTDKAVRQLAPDASPDARQRLADAVRATPQAAPQTTAKPQTTTPARAPRRIPAWVIGLAASLLLGLGWAVGRVTSPKPVVQAPVPPPTPNQPSPPVVPAPKQSPLVAGLPVAPHPSLPAGLNARAARHAAQVAGNTSPLAAAESFDRFAADVRAEALRRAGAGDLEGLARLADLHERLLKLGVAQQLSRVPEGQRGASAARIANELKRSADEMTTATAQLPSAVAALLQPLPASCREIAGAIREGKPPAAPAEWPNPPTPLELITVQTLRVADAATPLARADESVKLASALAQSAAVLSEAGWSDDAWRVGEAIAVVLEDGVATSLEQVETGDPMGILRAEVKQMRERAEHATDQLERDLTKANPVAKPGLERALNAVAPGRDKAAGKPPKTPGPPWKGDDHPGKGKGWQKKP